MLNAIPECPLFRAPFESRNSDHEQLAVRIILVPFVSDTFLPPLGQSNMASTGASRRGFLGFVTNLLMAAIGMIVAVPAVGYFLSPLRRKSKGAGASFQDAGPLSDIPVGQWRLVPLELVYSDGWKKTRVRQAIWVRRQEEADRAITVLSSICPHLGCPVNWHPDQSQFTCPCHGGIFDSGGQHAGGPPPRAMDPLDFEVRAGRLWVRWQDFKIGVAERVPVSV
jgi:Rieske Fe-S protein